MDGQQQSPGRTPRLSAPRFHVHRVNDRFSECGGLPPCCFFVPLQAFTQSKKPGRASLARPQNAETVILSPPSQAGRRISMRVVAEERFSADWTWRPFVTLLAASSVPQDDNPDVLAKLVQAGTCESGARAPHSKNALSKDLADHTSHSLTACLRPFSGSPVGMNSWPT